MGVCINRYVGQHEKTQPMDEDSEQDKKQQAESRKPQPSSSRQPSMIDSSFSSNATGLVQASSPSNYDKLCLSLLCGLPNEQELALNVCTILSNEGSYMLQLEQAPKLVDLLIAQTGVWRLDDDSTKLMYLESWQNLEGRKMCQFWQSTLDVKFETLLQLLGFTIGEYESYRDLFNVENDLGSLNAEGQRVLRVALILHNLSFEKNNVPVLVQSNTFLRFLLLSINSSWSNLKQTAYDTLSNVASAVKLSIEKDACSRLLFQAVTDGIQSYDRFFAIRSMDILSQLCSCDPNEDVIPSRLDIEVYQQLVFYLTAHDIMLLFYTLEALYALSDLGRYPCDRIACVHGSIGSLVSLLTIDPSQYGPSAQIRMKIVETLVPSESVGELEDKTESSAETATDSTSASSSATTPGNVDSETFACNWLKSMYEVTPGSVTSRNDVYADYVSFCGKAGRKGVLNANVFAGCVKNSFPQCPLKKITSAGGVVTFHHDGLKRKNVVTSLGVPPVSKATSVNTAVQKNPATTSVVTPSKAPPKPVQSPILKAQLSAPATASPTPLLKTYSQSVAAKAVSSAAINRVTNTSSSTLIKSLLANKVQQRNLQQNVPRMVIYSPGKVTGLAPGIHSPTTIVRCIRPGALSQINQLRPSLQARIVPNKGCIIAAPNSGVIKANPMWAPKQHVVKQSLLTAAVPNQVQINGIQSELKTEVHLDSEDSKSITLVPSVHLKPPNPVSLENQFLNDSGIDTKDSLMSDDLSARDNNSDQNILLSPAVQDSSVTYKIATSGDPSSGNFFIVRSQSIALSSPVKEQQCTLVNGNDVVKPSVVQPKVVSPSSNILKSVLNEFESSPVATSITKHQMIQRESICKKAPLLNGLLDKGKLPLLEDFQSKTILLQNGGGSNRDGDNEMTKSVQLNVSQSTLSTCNSNPLLSMSVHPDIVSSSPSSSVFTISSNAISQGIFTVSSASSGSQLSLNSIASAVMPSPTNISAPISLNSIVIPAPSFNSVIIPASSLSSAIVHSSYNSTTAATNASLNSTATTTSPVLVPSVLPATSFHSNGTDLMQICTGQTTFSGTVEVQPDQKGVVRLHIESPENSNQGSDLSSISDIARTLECASQAISRTNAECNTQVPYSSNACVAAPQTVTLINSNTPTLATRTGQQIFVVTPVLNQPQLQLQSPNIKLCILQSIPKNDDTGDLVSIPQVNFNQLRHPAPETSTLKRPSSETLCVAASLKKPRMDSPLLEASLRLPTATAGAIVVDNNKPHETLPVLLKSSISDNTTPKTTAVAAATPVQNADLPCDKEIKTFSGLTSASGNSPHVTATTTTRTTTTSSKLEFICEWKDCGLKFSSHGLVFLHASKAHVPHSDDAICQWEGCDSMKRKRFSLLTHLQDWHCSERVLHTQAVRRLQLSQQGKTSVPPPQKPPPHPGYAPDAAMLAIKRHALQYINPKELSEEKESALTKSIRLTSALILRNLVTHSSVARTYMRRFEPELAYLAMSPVESARTIAQCLSELSRTHD